jgi:hypothetical protein
LKYTKNIILPVVLYVYETWFSILRKGTRLRISENRMLKIMFEPKSEEVAGGWRRLHNEELHNLYASPNFIRVIKSKRLIWAVHVARMEEMINAYTLLIGVPEGRIPFRKPGISA